MAQVNKFQTGSGANGIQARKIKFKVDGNDYEKDEQFIKDQFTPMFDQLIASGEAKEKDRDKWLNTFNQYVGQASSGTYNINSSAGKALNGTYDGSATNTGLNENGETARKTGVGNFLAKARKSPEQMMAMINSHLSNAIVGTRSTELADAKTKADADANKAKEDAKTAALNKFKSYKDDYGTTAYGDDYKQNADHVLGKYWDKSTNDKQRLSQLTGYAQNKLKTLFDSSLDTYKDDINKTYGVDLDKLRGQASELYDNSTGTFKTQPKYLKDISRFSNLWDTMASDEKFFANGTVAKGDGTAAGKGGANTPVVTADLNKAEGRNNIGMGKDNVLYDKDTPYSGYYVDPKGYYAGATGTYVQGKKVNREQYENWFRGLEADPNNSNLLQTLDRRRTYAQQIYNRDFDKGKFADLNKVPDKTRDTYAFRGYDKPIQRARNITSNLQGFQGFAAEYLDDKYTDDLGNPKVRNFLRLPNGKIFVGQLDIDRASGSPILRNHLNRQPLIDPDLTKALKAAKWTDKYDPETRSVFLYESMNQANSNPRAEAIHNSRLNHHKDGGVIKAQMGARLDKITDEPKRVQQTVGGISRSMDRQKGLMNKFDGLSKEDKYELGALAADLTGLGFSLTGAGSVVAGGLGVGSTIASFASDVSRDGMDGGDWLRGGIGLALDAASFVPGLSVGVKAHKTLQGLTKGAKYLVPALTAIGVLDAAGTVTDLVSGKKSISDLSVDEVRSLVSGIHGVIGGQRMLGHKLATTKGKTTTDYLTLKDGKKFDLKGNEAATINAATDKVKAAKEIIAARPNSGLKPEDVQLGETRSFDGMKLWKGKSVVKENADINTSTTNTELKLKDINKYNGNSLWDRYMRHNIKSAAIRDPRLRSKDTAKRFGAFGDYFRGNGPSKTKSSAETVSSKTPFDEVNNSKVKLLGDGIDPETGVRKPAGDRTFIMGDTKRPGVVEERIAPGAFDSKLMQSLDKLNKRHDASAENILNNVAKKLQPKAKGSITSAINNNAAISDLKKSVGLPENAKIRRDVAKNLFKDKMGLTAKQKEEVDKFLKTSFAKGSKGDKVQKQIIDSFTNKKSKGYLKFEDGGVVKAATGLKLPFLNTINVNPQLKDLTLEGLTPTGKQLSLLGNGIKFNQTLNGVGQFKGAGTTITQDVKPFNLTVGNKGSAIGMNSGSSAPSLKEFINNVANKTKSLDKNTLSEFGRALYTRNLNSNVDTRVERPMLTAPAEVSVPVRGNLLAKSAHDRQANDLIRGANTHKTSDAMLDRAINLDANSRASAIRLQGDMVNAQALEANTNRALENTMKNNQIRTDVANQNTQTLARATQAERGAENEKFARMNQPLADFWKNENYKSMVKDQQNDYIDQNLAGMAEESKVKNRFNSIQTRYNELDRLLADTNLTADKKKVYTDEQTQLNTEYSSLQNRLKEALLNIRKDKNWVSDPNFYNLKPTVGVTNTNGAVSFKKEGGSVKVAVENIKQENLNNREISKQHKNMIEDAAQEDNKKSLAAMRQIQELIKLALS